MKRVGDRPLIEGDYYQGAFGPSILLVLTSRKAVSWLDTVFETLETAEVDRDFRLDSQPGVEIGAAVTAFLMRRVIHPPRRHLVRERDGTFRWSCVADEWHTARMLLEPLRTQAGHQYLTSETDDDAIIEVSFGEKHA